MLSKINETNESFHSQTQINLDSNQQNDSKNQQGMQSGSSTNCQSILNKKKQSDYNQLSSLSLIKNKSFSQKAEVSLDNSNIILEDYEDGESIIWYRNKIDEINGNEMFQKNDVMSSNIQPKFSKLSRDKFNDEKKYQIKDLESGIQQDIRDSFIIKELKTGSSIIPRKVDMGKCWSKWWQKKKEINKQFMKACQLNFNDKILEFINTTDSDLKPLINQVDDSGFSPLHYSAQFGNLQITNLLISNDADLELTNYSDQTPLILASFHNHEQLVFLLVNAGCDLNAKDLKQNTALHYAFMNGNKTIIEILMRKVQLNPQTENLEQKLPYELSYDTDLVRLYNNLMAKREEIQENLQKNTVQIVHKTSQEINETFQSSINEYNSPKKKNQSTAKKRHSRRSSDSNQYNDKNKFKVIGQIGKGSFGEVFLVQHAMTQKKYALKMLRKTDLIKQQMMKYAYTERNILSQSDSPFVAKLHYAFQTKDKLFLVMDYGNFGDLGTHLQIERKFEESKARFYGAQVLLAIEHLHSRDVIYRDLKSDNIIICEDGYLKLTDFGLAKENVSDFSYGAQSFCGSIAYMPPEMLKNKSVHGKSLDLYLLGVLIFELLTGQPPFFSLDTQQLYQNIQFSQVKFPQYISKTAKNLITKLLQKDPRFRPTYDEVKRHPFFKSIDWNLLQKKQIKPPEPTLTKEKFRRIYYDIFEEDKNENNDIQPSHLQSWTFVENNNYQQILQNNLLAQTKKQYENNNEDQHSQSHTMVTDHTDKNNITQNDYR